MDAAGGTAPSAASPARAGATSMQQAPHAAASDAPPAQATANASPAQQPTMASTAPPSPQSPSWRLSRQLSRFMCDWCWSAKRSRASSFIHGSWCTVCDGGRAVVNVKRVRCMVRCSQHMMLSNISVYRYRAWPDVCVLFVQLCNSKSNANSPANVFWLWCGYAADPAWSPSSFSPFWQPT